MELLSGARGLVTGDRGHPCHSLLGGLWQSFSCPGGGRDMGTVVSVRSDSGHVPTRLGTVTGCSEVTPVLRGPQQLPDEGHLAEPRGRESCLFK